MGPGVVTASVVSVVVAFLVGRSLVDLDNRRTTIAQSGHPNDSSLIEEATSKDYSLVSESKPETKLRAPKWIHQYIDEQTREFTVKVEDETPDQRLANTIRLSYLTKVAYFFSYKFDSSLIDEAQLEQSAAGPRVNDAECSQHLRELLKQMQQMEELLELRKQNRSERFEEKHLRLAKVLDSFGRYEAGFLLGRTHSLGSYTQCKGSQLLLDGQLVSSRYCMANVDVSQNQHPSVKLSRIDPTEDVISVAICLPESCHTRNFNANKELLQTLVASQFKLPTSIYQEEQLPLKSVFCELDEDSPLLRIPFSGKLLLMFAGVWICAALYSTYSSNRHKSNQTGYLKVIKCLNLRDSWEDFIGNNRNFTDPNVSLDTLNPIKVLGCLYVVLGHAVIVHLVVVMDAIRSAKEFEDDPWMLLVAGLTVIVDSFYVITGMIIAYIAMKKVDRRKQQSLNPMRLIGTVTKQCVSFIMVRYSRLVPLYFLVFWFKKSLMPVLSSGPLWDHGYNRETEAGACREESWLTPLTFQAAYLPLTKQCMPQGWSVAGDLFFSIAAAPIIILMAHKPKLAALLSVAICIASNVSLTLGVLSIDSNILDDLMKARGIALAGFIKTQSYIYTAPHYRVFSILIGVLAGYALHHGTRKPSSSGKDGLLVTGWPGWFSGPATKIAICFAVLDLGLPMLAPYTRENLLGQQLSFATPHGLFIYVETTGRLLWAISSAIIFLRMVTDWKDNYWIANGAGKFWSSAAKLNYTILLIHMDVLKFDGYMQLSTSFYSRYAILKLFASTYFFCIPMALGLHLLFENPINKLTKLLYR